MPNSKTPKNHKTPKPTTSVAKAERSARKRVHSDLGGRLTVLNAKAIEKFIVPGAAVLGSGLLAITGLLLRDQLHRLARAAVKSAAAGGSSVRDAAGRQLDLQKLLAHVGLEQKRHSVTGMTVGVVAGLLAGSALTAFFAPLVKAKLESRIGTQVSGEQPAMNNLVHDGAPV